ncbi:MAG: hypothetical protein AAF215_24335 [Cyanobacteria bacterium P01_A01_bin.123]
MFIGKTDATAGTAAAEILAIDDALAVLDSLSPTPPLTTLQAQLIRGTWDRVDLWRHCSKNGL